MKRLFTIVVLSLIAATVPIVGDAEGGVRIALSTASCAQGDCGGLSKLDCICPDMQEQNRKPRCVEPGW